MLIALLFGAIVGNLFNAQLSFEDCKQRKFEPKSCAIQKELYEASEKLK